MNQFIATAHVLNNGQIMQLVPLVFATLPLAFSKKKMGTSFMFERFFFHVREVFFHVCSSFAPVFRVFFVALPLGFCSRLRLMVVVAV